MNFRIIIPARYNSTRLPGKLLLDIAGKPMLQHVYERAQQSGAASVVIATDDEKIRVAAKNFGASVCMTSSNHQSGTERLTEAAKLLGYAEDEIIVNVQGDEPLIPPIVIQQAAHNLANNPQVKMATLCNILQSSEELHDPHLVKVVLDKHGFALYFSRAPIPHNAKSFYHHIGIYAYRVNFLQEYINMPFSVLAQTESLEQLRVLENGDKIHVAVAKEAVPAGVDTENDLQKIRQLFQSKNCS